jgi:23S rRNA (cytidine1920-2'-O)/16S rRNA (cytidine1409-2'-O)-methyltransferase
MKGETKQARIRADELVIKQGITDNIDKARALIIAGQILTGDRLILKPGEMLDEGLVLRCRVKTTHGYVARSALKLKEALAKFSIPVEGKVCLDVGSSTGGFTQVLLNSGAIKVYAIDVGKNQLDWSIRKNERVISHEGLNIKEATTEHIPQKAEICSIDVSFISLKKVLPYTKCFLAPNAVVIALIKPQHEVQREEVGHGGIVQNEELHKRVTTEISAYAESIGFQVLGLIESPIRGTTGNKEFLIYLKS